jgi:hypothetical protein
VVGDAEAALVIAHEQPEVAGAVKLVAIEAEEVPVVVRRRDRVVQLTGIGLDADAAAGELHELPHLHHGRVARPVAADPEDPGA